MADYVPSDLAAEIAKVMARNSSHGDWKDYITKGEDFAALLLAGMSWINENQSKQEEKQEKQMACWVYKRLYIPCYSTNDIENYCNQHETYKIVAVFQDRGTPTGVLLESATWTEVKSS
jgi:hypothetical protein